MEEKTQSSPQSVSCSVPERADLHDGDSSDSVIVHDGVEDGSWTSPPRQQAGVYIQNPTAHIHTEFMTMRSHSVYLLMSQFVLKV